MGRPVSGAGRTARGPEDILPVMTSDSASIPGGKLRRQGGDSYDLLLLLNPFSHTLRHAALATPHPFTSQDTSFARPASAMLTIATILTGLRFLYQQPSPVSPACLGGAAPGASVFCLHNVTLLSPPFRLLSTSACVCVCVAECWMGGLWGWLGLAWACLACSEPRRIPRLLPCLGGRAWACDCTPPLR